LALAWQRVERDLRGGVLGADVDASTTPRTQGELRQLIDDLGLTGQVRVE
jgi:hypothetical protein